MNLKSVVFAICLSLLVLTGCSTFKTNNYGVSPENMEKLQSYSDQGAKKITAQRLTSFKAGINSVKCRGASLELPNGMSFEDYISNALITELKLARLYSETAEKTLKGHLEIIDLATFGSGQWTLKATFTTSTGSQFSIDSNYTFDADFAGLKACQEAAQNFVPAVNQFNRKVITHPNFVKFILDQ